MVICVVALVVFSFLSIWSVKYRNLAKEAFRCVSRMIVFKPCDVNLENRIKTKVTSKLMFFPSLANFFYRHFKAISWIFTISFFASLIYSAYGIYNLAVYGNCQPGSGSVCVMKQGVDIFSEISKTISCYELQIVYSLVIIVALALIYISYKNSKTNRKKAEAA